MVLGLLGAVVGGTVGYFAFGWALREGFYALALPGALLGLGAGMASRVHSNLLGAICGVAALVLSVFSEWSWRPFGADGSLSYFLSNLSQLTSMTWLMIVVGTLFGFWFGQGRAPASRQPAN